MTTSTVNPTRTAAAPDEDDMWGRDWATEDRGRTSKGGGYRRGEAKPELPPLRTLAERRRRPTGAASHPFLLVSGGDHSGKSYELAKLTGDDRLGRAYWFEIGQETTADWYGLVPGADYDLIEHDGTWRDIMSALAQSHAEAHELVSAADYDARPPLLCIDSGTGEWEHLSLWAAGRAMLNRGNVVKLLEDPHADIDIGATLWNAANTRHKAFMTYVLTWPGPVVMTARGKMALAVDDGGNLKYNSSKAYTVECQRGVPFAATMHVRLDAKLHPEVLGYRHPTRPIGGKYGSKSVVIDPADPKFRGVEFSLAWLLFGVMKYDPTTAVVRALNDPVPTMDYDEQHRPAVRTLRPESVDGDEVPDGAVADDTDPRPNRAG